jgi:hypothetical protein
MLVKNDVHADCPVKSRTLDGRQERAGELYSLVLNLEGRSVRSSLDSHAGCLNLSFF